MSDEQDTEPSDRTPTTPPGPPDPVLAAFESLLLEQRKTTAAWHLMLEKHEQMIGEHAAAGVALKHLAERQETMLKMLTSFFDQLQEVAPTLQKTQGAIAEHETRIGTLEIQAARGTLLPPPRGNGSDHPDDG